MMSSSRIACLQASPACRNAIRDLDKLLQDTGNSVERILSNYTASGANTSGPEVFNVRTSLSMGIAPAIHDGGHDSRTNVFYKDNVSVSNLGPTQYQASASNIVQCLDVENWYSQKHSSLMDDNKSCGANEGALRGLLEEIKKAVCNWSFRHVTILQDMSSRSASHNGVAVNPGLYLPKGAPCSVGFEREPSPVMCMSSLGGDTSGGEGLQVRQTQKEEENRVGKREKIVQQNQEEESRSGFIFQQDKEAGHLSFETEMEKSGHLDKVVNDIACQLQSDEQPTIGHSQDLSGSEAAACFSLQGSNPHPLSTEANVASTAQNTGRTPLKENERAAESLLTPTNTDQTGADLPITKWTPPTSAIKTINKSLSFPRTVEVIASPDWLPEGWVTELKTRGSGNSAGSKDKYYVDPVSHRRFRSRKEVIAYLERCKLKSSDDSPEASPIKKYSAPELLPSLPIKKYSAPEVLPSLPNKSNKKTKLKESGTPITTALPPPMVPSIASPGLLSNMFMPPFRTGQPSEWLVYESLASLPFPMFDPFYYKDFGTSKSSSAKGSHTSTRPWFFTGPEASWNPFMDRSSLGKSGDKGRDYPSYFSMPSYPSEVGSKLGARKSAKRKSAGL